jgi:signal transduction histidine kinase
VDVDLRRPLVGVARIEVRDYGRPLGLRERERLEQRDHGWEVNRHIVERHGGSLSVEYPTEGGVRVAISLPTNRGRIAARAQR